ncbi:MAG: imidazolonepropionase [Chitinophagaceae bacterium]|nr:MAG: imidazolonepropionase [Chitinophagaceae bacterium]
MHHLLITNIGHLGMLEKSDEKKLAFRGREMQDISVLQDAWLFLEDHKIHSYGKMEDMDFFAAENVYDAGGRSVLPAWVDSHTHLVFAAPREQEFVDRIKGLSYEDIAQRGGGILNSARRLNDVTEEELFDQSLERLHRVISQGTGAIEIKSGYGLSLYSELKMLRVIRKLKEQNLIPVKASFLAAHAFPPEYKNDHAGYIRLIIEDILPQVADEGLADYMDVFCEKGFFNIEETQELLEAGWKYGLKPKIHANQLYNSGGVQVGIRQRAISVDHLECIGEEEIEALKQSDTIPTLLPGAAFFLGMHYQPARKLIDAGLPVCLATDYNPGSCPSGNIPLLLTLACTQMKMTPEEAISAVTINGAAALELSTELGTIAEGKIANLVVTQKIPSLSYIPYDFGNNPVEKMILNGVFI